MEKSLYNNRSLYRLLPTTLSFVVMLLGALVMMGWIIRNESLVQISSSFVPMQFNTALAFLFSGAALWGVIEKYYQITLSAAILVLIISGLTLSQYLFGIDLNIDQLLMEHYIDTNTSSPGRMAPNTAVCFLLLSCVGILTSYAKSISWAKQVSFIGIVIALALSLVAFTGYFNGIESSYGWGRYTQMALHTSVGFILISVAFVIIYLQRWQAVINPVNITALFSIFIITVTFTLWQAISSHEHKQVLKQLNFYADNIEKDLLSEFIKYSDGLVRLKRTIESSSFDLNNAPTQFNSQLINYSAMDSLSLMTTPSEVEFTHPDTSYESLFTSFSYRPSHMNNQLLVSSDNSIVGVSDVKKFGALGNYFVLFSKAQIDDYPDIQRIVALIDVDNFITAALERYESYPLEIKIDDASGRLYPIVWGTSNNDLKTSRKIMNSGWTVQVSANSMDLADGSLANVVLAFGLIFSALVAAISQLFLNAREKASRLSSEVSSRKEAHRKVTEAKLITELASKVSGLGVWTWDLRTNELTWDENMYRIYQVPVSLVDHQLLYDNWQEALHPEDREGAEKSLLQAIREKTDWYHEFRLVVKNNKVRFIKAAGTIIFDDDGIPVTMIGGNLDITQLREAQERMEVLKEQSDKNNLAKSQFLANMSHEIRTPMNGVLGITDLLQQTKLTPLQQEYLELIKTSASSLLRILNDILDHSKIEAGMLELSEDHFSLDNKVGDLLKGFAPTAHQKMIELEYNIEASIPDCVYADPMRVGQIIFNLVGNAVKFTQTGEVIVEISTNNDMKLRSPGDDFILQIAVKDTGVGIPKAKIDTIFEPFGQADNTTTRRFGGTGLGLPIVRQLVYLMGGRLSLESQESIGTLMTVEIPVKVGDQAMLDHEEGHAHIINSFDFSGITCLAVDDNSINRKWLNNMISSWGCKAIVAGSGEQALALYQSAMEKRDKIDVLIIDKDMPGMDGFSLLERLKGQYKNIPTPVFMLNSSDIAEDLELLRQNEIEHYLLKPVKQSEVFNALTEILQIERPDLQSKSSTELAPPERLLNVLVAEDNPINSRLVHDILTYRGHNSSLVFNGKQALEQYKSEDYDLILMDVQMPEMDGLEATSLIRKFEKHRGIEPIKIVGLTAHALSGDREVCLDAGMDDYLTKPIDSARMLTTIESYFSSSDDTKPLPEQVALTKQQTPENNPETNKKPTEDYRWFDFDDVMKVTSGQLETVEAMVSMTMNILPQEIADVAEMRDNEEWSSVAKQLHRMKGMLGNLTGSRLQSQFIELEQVAKSEDLPLFNRLWAAMELKLKAFLMELEDFEDRSKK